jgi:hypothetical protein
MMLAGADAYEAWASDPDLAEDVGELVSQVYGAMRAQEIARDQQMAEVAGRPARSVA